MKTILLAVLMASTLAFNALAGPLTIPNSFTPNTPALAEEVNANFDEVATEVTDNYDLIRASEAGPIYLPAAAFRPKNSAHDYELLSGRSLVEKVGSSGTFAFVAPVIIPAGRLITEISAGVVDSSSQDFFEIGLLWLDFDGSVLATTTLSTTDVFNGGATTLQSDPLGLPVQSPFIARVLFHVSDIDTLNMEFIYLQVDYL